MGSPPNLLPENRSKYRKVQRRAHRTCEVKWNKSRCLMMYLNPCHSCQTHRDNSNDVRRFVGRPSSQRNWQPDVRQCWQSSSSMQSTKSTELRLHASLFVGFERNQFDCAFQTNANKKKLGKREVTVGQLEGDLRHKFRRCSRTSVGMARFRIRGRLVQRRTNNIRNTDNNLIVPIELVLTTESLTTLENPIRSTSRVD